MNARRAGDAVAIVAANASLRFGGESAIPYHYFAQLEREGCRPVLFVHARCRDELLAAFPDAVDRLVFVPDSALHRLIHQVGKRLPGSMREATLDVLLRLLTQAAQVQQLRALGPSFGIGVVHQPTPVSPLEPTLLHKAGYPLIVGPMNGAMSYPPDYVDFEDRASRLLRRIGKRVARSPLAYRGKARARVLLVANERTRDGLPAPLRPVARVLPENGVDLDLWQEGHPTNRDDAGERICRFVFIGRLVRWKNVDVLIEAFRLAQTRAVMSLTIVGNGEQEETLRRQATRSGDTAGSIGLAGSVHFTGWLPSRRCAEVMKQSDCLVLPSVWECGGAVVLEALACGLPVLASEWGGPADYLDETCGVLIPPSPRGDFAKRLADRMVTLAGAPHERKRLGRAGREKVEQTYSWRAKANTMRSIYEATIKS